MDWHLRENEKLAPREKVTESKLHVSRRKVFKMLRKRYNVNPKDYGKTVEITLPHTKARANVIINSVEAAITSLLTDPRIRDEDCMFFDNDPLAAPPDTLDCVGDLNTGLACTETYRKLVTKKDKQVLLPVIFYIDGAVAGHFAG